MQPVLAIAALLLLSPTLDWAAAERPQLGTQLGTVPVSLRVEIRFSELWEPVGWILSEPRLTAHSWGVESSWSFTIQQYTGRLYLIVAPSGHTFVSVALPPLQEERPAAVRIELGSTNSAEITKLFRIDGEAPPVESETTWGLRLKNSAVEPPTVTFVEIGLGDGLTPSWRGEGPFVSDPMVWNPSRALAFAVVGGGGQNGDSCGIVHYPDYSGGLRYWDPYWIYLWHDVVVDPYGEGVPCADGALIVYSDDSGDKFKGNGPAEQNYVWATYKLWCCEFTIPPYSVNQRPDGATATKYGGSGDVLASIGCIVYCTQFTIYNGGWHGTHASVWYPLEFGHTYEIDSSSGAGGDAGQHLPQYVQG